MGQTEPKPTVKVENMVSPVKVDKTVPKPVEKVASKLPDKKGGSAERHVKNIPSVQRQYNSECVQCAWFMFVNVFLCIPVVCYDVMLVRYYRDHACLPLSIDWFSLR